MQPRTVVLVEGRSDRAAVHALALRLGRDLAAEGVEVLPMGGVTNTRTFALHYGPPGLGLRLAGLYDAPEELHVRRGLSAAGLTPGVGSDGLAAFGFFACHLDLEDELIRAVGVAGTHAVIAAQGETRSYDLLAQMPGQRGWSADLVLRRFFTSQSGRKERYATAMVEALDLDRVPRPLTALLETW